MTYPQIRHILRTLFNAEDGFSEQQSRAFYIQSVHEERRLDEVRDELQRAFDDPNLSWRGLLLNSEFEVFDASSEAEAREYAKRNLWDPLFDGF